MIFENSSFPSTGAGRLLSAIAVGLTLSLIQGEAIAQISPPSAGPACRALIQGNVPREAVTAVLHSAEQEAFAGRDWRCLGVVGQYLTSVGECEQGELAISHALAMAPGDNQNRCLRSLSRLCGVMRQATRAGDGNIVDCAPLGGPESVAELTVSCLGTRQDNGLAAASVQLIDFALVCRDDGYLRAALSTLNHAMGRRVPELEYVRVYNPPAGLTDARLMSMLSREMPAVQQEVQSGTGSHDPPVSTGASTAAALNRHLPGRSLLYLLRVRARDLLTRLIASGRHPGDTVLSNVANYLIRLDSRVARETSGALGVLLGDIELLTQHGLLTEMLVQDILDWPAFNGLANTRMGPAEQSALQALANNLCSVRAPSGLLACFRISGAIALRSNDMPPCDRAQELLDVVLRFTNNPAISSISRDQYRAQLQGVAEEGVSLSMRCPTGATALQSEFERIVRLAGASTTGGAVQPESTSDARGAMDFTGGGEMVRGQGPPGGSAQPASQPNSARRPPSHGHRPRTGRGH